MQQHDGKMTCWRCKERKDGVYGSNYCIDCYRLNRRDEHRRIRRTVIERYGGKCLCCGEAQFEFLCIDHADGTRRSQRNTANELHRLYGLPIQPGILVSCYNCNQARSSYGVCPHQKAALEFAEQRRQS